ncbi:MAG: hypothetical protein AAFY65_05080 [Pseudomonadota bacterium]
MIVRANITRCPSIRRLRSEASNHIRLFRNGNLRRDGRGLSIWFDPSNVSTQEVPLADREVNFLVKA